jgi:digeranylgeranylglycerophospholipid reductase
MMQRIPESFDVVVIGAGPAGCSAALPAAGAGLSVLLVDRESADDVGRKVCGNAMVPTDLDPVASQVSPPAGAEVAAHLDSGTFYVTDGTGVRVPGQGVVLNRLIFGQRLLSDAVAAGAQLVDRCSCVGWSDRDATRVRLRLGNGDEVDVSARVVIEAAGFRSVLAHDGGTTYEDPIRRTEVAVGYREILSLPTPIDEKGGGFIVFAPPGAERGYAWVFPMGGRLANVGIGTMLASVRGSLRDAYDAFVASRPELAGAERITGGAGMIPIRRSLASLIGDGFMVVGDAGCQTSPLHGGGIVPAIRAGVMAGEQAVAAIATGSTSAEALWPYGRGYMSTIGGNYAAHDVLKDLLYSLSRSEMAFLCEQLARSDRLIRTLQKGSLLPGAGEALKRLAAFTRRPRLAGRIVGASRAMSSIRRHYQDYPDSPTKLNSWAGRLEFLRRAGRATRADHDAA